jgi:hypothetical protein
MHNADCVAQSIRKDLDESSCTRRCTSHSSFLLTPSLSLFLYHYVHIYTKRYVTLRYTLYVIRYTPNTLLHNTTTIYSLVDDVLGRDTGDKVQMEKVVMLIWQFRDDPSVVTFMARFVAKVSREM